MLQRGSRRNTVKNKNFQVSLQPSSGLSFRALWRTQKPIVDGILSAVLRRRKGSTGGETDAEDVVEFFLPSYYGCHSRRKSFERRSICSAVSRKLATLR